MQGTIKTVLDVRSLKSRAEFAAAVELKAHHLGLQGDLDLLPVRFFVVAGKNWRPSTGGRSTGRCFADSC